MYGTEGKSPCDDVLLLPIMNTQLFQYIKISTANYLQLCEVQIFAGKQNALCLFSLQIGFFLF